MRWNAPSSSSTGASCAARSTCPAGLRREATTDGHPRRMVDPVLVRHGVLTAAQLRLLGWSRRDRDAAVADGRLTRVRDGWFAASAADPRVVAAVRAGGCLGCASALRAHGAWVPESLGRDHVRLARRADGAGTSRGCRPYGRMPPVHDAVDPIDVAFRCLLRCGSDEDVVVVADSLLHLGLATMHELERWVDTAPSRFRALLSRTAAAESGLESIVRLRLRRHRIGVRTQVQIDDMRVDMVVGEVLVIECDGAEHHGSWAAHAADRARDRRLAVMGYRVIRLTYRQVLDDWPAVERDILALVRADAHRAPRTR